MTLTPRIALSLLLLAGAGCTTEPGDPATTPSQADVIASEEAATSAVDIVPASESGETSLRPGQLLLISLVGNPSTGYNWEIESDGAPQLALAPPPDGAPAATPATEANRPVVGSPTTRKLYFEAVQPGSTVVRLVYHRPWEKDVAPERTAEFNVTVTDARP